MILHPTNDTYNPVDAHNCAFVWTSYGLLSPAFIVTPEGGGIVLVYVMKKGADFHPNQKKKLEYVRSRGVNVEVEVRSGEEGGDE